MSIDNISSNPELQGVNQVHGMNSHQRPDMANMPEEMKQRLKDIVGLSEMGSLLSEAEKLGGDTADAFRSFGKSIAESMRDGTFNAASLAENAPDAVKQLAEEKGIDLASAVTDMTSRLEQMKPPKGMGPGGKMGPPVMANDQDYQSTFMEALESASTEDEEEEV